MITDTITVSVNIVYSINIQLYTKDNWSMQKGTYHWSVPHNGPQSIALETVKMPKRTDPIPRSWQRSQSWQWIHIEAILIQHTSFCVILFIYRKYIPDT